MKTLSVIDKMLVAKKVVSFVNTIFCEKNYSSNKFRATISELALTYHAVKQQHSYNSVDCSMKLNYKVFAAYPHGRS